jgi:hypothetical protein
MSVPISLRSIAGALGGKVHGDHVRAPGPGHSKDDDSLSVKLGGPDGFIVHSFASDDPIHCKDYVRQRLGMPKWEPGRGHNGRNALPPRELKRERARFDYTDADGMRCFRSSAIRTTTRMAVPS